MFDLFRSREKSVRYLLGALMVVVAASMLAYLIPSYNNMGAGGQEMIVAEVGDEAIPLLEVQRAIQNMTRNRQIPPEVVPNMIPTIVESLVTERALAHEAEKRGMKVSEADVAAAIRQMAPALFGPDGSFIGRDQYQAMLAQQNMTIPEFEREVSRQVLVNRLRNLVLEGVIVAPQEIEQEYRQRNEKIQVEYVKIQADEYRAQAQVSPEEIRAHYEKNRATFQTPEKRSYQLAVIDQAQVEQNVQSSDADLQRLYEQDKERFRTPERAKVRHILLNTTGKTPDEEKAVQAKAEALLKKVKAGANLAELAKENSEDPGSAQTGGELPGWITRGQTVPEFEKVAFSQAVGQTSDLVKTQYGYHIIQVLDREQARLQPFQEAKAELLPEVRQQRVVEAMDELAVKLQDALRRNPDQAQQIARQFNVRMVDVNPSGAGEPLPEIGVSQDFDQAVSGLRKGEVSSPVQVPGNKMVIALVKDIVPAHPSPIEEVEGQIRETLAREKSTGVINQKAADLAQKAKAAGGDLRAAAKSMGLEVKTSEPVTRQGAVEGLGSASYIQEAFHQPVGSIVGPVSIPDAKVVAKVTGRTEADVSGLQAERDNLREEIKGRKARERNALFEDGIRQRLTQDGEVRIYQDVISRLSSNYRT
jgi:peptidyl-prolyl cis-trans isomerase D